MKSLALLFLVACVNAPETSVTHQESATVEILHALDNSFDTLTLADPYHAADGGHPRGLLLEVDGRVYGTAWQNGRYMGGDVDHSCSSNFYWDSDVQDLQCPGSIFSVALDGSDFRLEHSFTRLDNLKRNPDGYQPSGNLARGPDGRIYGVARAGGLPISAISTQAGLGVLYSFIPGVPESYTVHHNFGSYSRHKDGRSPHGGVSIAPDGTVYGTAITGNDGAGVIWKYPVGGPLENLHTLVKVSGLSPEGSTPYGTVIFGEDSLLHGSTIWGGSSNRGTVYTVDPASGALTVNHTWEPYTWLFNADNSPLQSQTLGSDGAVYGTMQFGGSNGNGIVYKLVDGQVEILKYFDPVYQTTSPGCPRYCNATGSLPLGSLMEGSDGLLYGTTSSGGTNGDGVIFRIARNGTLFQVLYNFTKDPNGIGYHPHAGLIQGEDGALYGTTFGGGPTGFGTVFRVLVPGLCP